MTQRRSFSALLRSTAISFSGVLLVMVLISLALDGAWVGRVIEGYPGDSFHTLTRWQGIGLVLITLIALATLFVVSWSQTWFIQERLCLSGVVVAILDIAFVVAFYWLLLSAAPQFFYGYYRSIMPGLPAQWVVHGLIPLAEFARMINLSPASSLANHAAGIAGWMLVLNKCQQWLIYLRAQH